MGLEGRRKTPDQIELHPSPQQRLEATQDQNYILNLILTIGDVIGQGQYGKVHVASLRSDKASACDQLFALKKLAKAGQETTVHALAEQRALEVGRGCPFIVRLYACFQTKLAFYLLLELAEGGRLTDVLTRVGRLPEPNVRFYAAQLFCAVAFLHENNILHRDLKLDNVLLDSTGYLRLCDFGLSMDEFRDDDEVASPCGTLFYVAPEVLRGESYGKSADWWSFGVLLYRMATGLLPFNGKNIQELYVAVTRKEPFFDSFLSPSLVSLLHKLLNKMPDLRPGHSAEDRQTLKDDAFFTGLDWEALHARSIVPPELPSWSLFPTVETDAHRVESDSVLSASLPLHGPARQDASDRNLGQPKQTRPQKMADKQDEGSSDGGHSGIPPPTDQQKELANQAFQEFEKGQPKSNDDPVDGIEDVDNAVMYYNQAVLNYHTRQYHTALQVLSKGFQYIEPPDELLAQNAAATVVEFISGFVRSGTAVQYLRAYFEYLRGNFRKAQKMLATAPGASGPVPVPGGESLAVMHHNNLGCIHMHLRKHHTAALFFRRAMQENDKAVKEVKATPKGKPMQTMGISKNCELLYNMGVQLLHCGKPSPAFECLIQAVQMYQVNPRLWLRLAECCIMANRENNDDDSKLEKRQQVIQGSVGSGYHRKLILGPGVGQDKTSTNAPSMPALSLEFAAMCLRNALLLLPDDPLGAETTVTDDSDGSKPTPEPVLLPAPPSSPMRAHEVANLRCSILAASSYVALCLNDHQVALQHAENLLRQPRLSGAQRYIGSMYMAEALVELDRIADAIGHLNPDSLTQADISTVPPEAKSDPEKIDKNDKGEREGPENPEDKGALCPWIPRELPKAKAMMQHNLAVAHAIRGEFDKANKYLGEGSKNNGTPLPAQMYYLKLYLDLMEGRRQMAQMIIKDHFGHVTPNRFQP
nr:hypothetical protein BaRGS_011969 [Batillaria attramentaria]